MWTTNGDGTFDDDTILNPVYTPGAGDIAITQVTLTLTVTGSASTCPAVADSLLVYIINNFFTLDITATADGLSFDYFVQAFTDMYVDYGDGSPLETFTGGGTFISMASTCQLL